MKTVSKLLEEASGKLLRENVTEPQLNAQVLLSHVLNCKKLDLFTRLNDVIDEKTEEMYNDKILKRSRHIPLNYITGSKEFMGLNFKITEGVLIPRDETEILVEETVKLVYDNKINQPFIFDIGSGSGNISVSLATLLPESSIFGIDISEISIKLARENATLNNVEKRANFICRDILSLSTGCNSLFPVPCMFPFDIIVSNPPYIPTDDINKLQEEIGFEPRESLDGGPDGLKFYRFISGITKKCLKNRGYVAVETGYNQAKEVIEIFEANKFQLVKISKDYMGYDRVVIFRS